MRGGHQPVIIGWTNPYRHIHSVFQIASPKASKAVGNNFFISGKNSLSKCWCYLCPHRSHHQATSSRDQPALPDSCPSLFSVHSHHLRAQNFCNFYSRGTTCAPPFQATTIPPVFQHIPPSMELVGPQTLVTRRVWLCLLMPGSSRDPCCKITSRPRCHWTPRPPGRPAGQQCAG